MRIHQIFLQILSINHLSYAVALNDLSDLENNVMVTWFKLGLRLNLVLLGTKFGKDTSNISSEILSGNQLSYSVALNDLCDLENKVKCTQFVLGLCHALVLLCIK